MKIKIASRLLRPLSVTAGPGFHEGCPVRWPWWQFFAVRVVRLSGIKPPSTGWAFWLYTRPCRGRYVDVFLDRR